MNNYEVALILNSNLPEKEITRVSEDVTNLLTQLGAVRIFDVRTERRSFAYPIKKQREGIYLFIRFQGPPHLPGQVRQELIHREDILRFAFFRLPYSLDVPSEAPKDLISPGKE